MQVGIFQTAVELEHSASELSIVLDDANGSELVLSVLATSGGQTHRRELAIVLEDVDGLDIASFNYDSLDRTYTLTVDRKAAQNAPFVDAVRRNGIVGANFSAAATLTSLKVVLRPRPAGGDWTSDHPCFALMACWDVNGSVSQSWEDETKAAEVDVQATVELCAGLSVVIPHSLDLGLPNFQVRLDLPAIGMTTDWLPLAWFEWPDLMPLSMEGLLAWFSGLLDFNWAQFPDLELPRLPEWDVDLPLSLDLPLGVAVETTHLRVQRSGGGLIVDAYAEGFYLTWQGQAVTAPRGLVRLHYDQPRNVYVVEARFYEAQYPESDATAPWEPYRFALPFDLIGLEAECWYLRIGLYFTNAGAGPRRACFEALLEIGGLKVTSRLTGDTSEGLYHSDVRLLLRDTTLVSANLAPGAVRNFLSDAVWPAGSPFHKWLNKPVPALSFAEDLLAPPTPGTNEYGITFLDGDFRSGERTFLLWRMSGRRLLKALAHDLLGREAAGAVTAAEEMTDFGLEMVKEGSGATQIRLDWRAAASAAPSFPGAGAPAAAAGNCIPGDKLEFNVPFPSTGTYLDGNFSDPLSLGLPAISLEVARPRTQSIVVRAEPDGSHSASHLLLFDGGPKGPADQPVPPLARARIGFSLKQVGASNDERDVVETQPEAPDTPFLSVGLGHAGEGDVALRTVGWRRGRSPRFLEVLPNGASPIRSLIPANLPNIPGADPGCPGAKPAPLPPAALDFDAFETPRFGNDTWRLSVKIAATDALFKMFGDTSAGQSVSFKIKQICIDEEDDRVVLLKTSLSFTLGSGADRFVAAGDVTFRFDLRDLSLSLEDGSSLAFRLPKQALAANEAPAWTAEAPLPRAATTFNYSEELTLLGMKMTVLADKASAKPGDDPDTIDALSLTVKGGRFVLALPADRWVVLRYTGLGRGSLNFWVTEFVLGPGGLDATGALISNALRVKGLKNPFLLEQATLRIRSSRLDYLSVSGSGVLPELLDEAPVKIAITFKQDTDGSIDIDSLDAQLGDKGKPIFSRGTRFKFEIQQLGLAYRRAPDGGERHFFFELTGSAQFTPESNEFSSGLLENLKSVRMDFVRVPLTDEFAEHISLSIELKRPIVFSVFGVFRMEIRSIGFHPKFAKFGAPTAAIIIGGQVEFADTGDVIRAEIDFHAMYIGLPKPDSSVPQVYFDGLRVDISTAEGFRIGGRVDTYKSDVLDGFAGEGTVQIPGFPELSAAFSFVRVRKTPDDQWQRAWFIAIEAAKISYLVGGALPIYLRQVGLGFGYRYTLPMIVAFEEHDNLPDLIKAMLKEVGKHQTLAHIDSWTPETEGRRWTIALEAVLSLGSANSSPFDYNEKAEREIRTIFTQILAAYRSDFTLVAAAKLWFPVSVDDFFRNTENMRERPLASGFFAFSAPQNRLLAHVRKNQNPYIGSDKNQPIPYPLKLALEKSYFEATLLIEPGLIHAELGWPDRLGFDLTVGPMTVGCRAGILMRLERDLLVYGYYFTAYGELNLGGGVDFGFVGVRVEALVRVQYATRLLIGANLRKPLASHIYGSIGLDIAVRFLVRAWLRLKFKFFKISIDISFSFSLQLSVLGEIGWAGSGDIGFRGRAQFVIGVFGRSLAVKIDVGVNKGAVEQAKRYLKSYAGSFLEPGKAPPVFGIDDGLGARSARRSRSPLMSLDANEGPGSPLTLDGAIIEFDADTIASLGVNAAGAVPLDSFVTATVLGDNSAEDGDKLYFAWIMPGPNGQRFYPVAGLAEDRYAELDVPASLLADASCYVLRDGVWEQLAAGVSPIQANLDATVELEPQEGGGNKETLSLAQLIAGGYVPNFPKTIDTLEKEDFPRNWPRVAPDSLTLPTQPEIGGRIYDDRVFDPTNAARGPRRMLDEANAFDRAILESIEPQDITPDDPNKSVDYFAEQALSNQSLLLQGFYDDLSRIARTTRHSAMGGAVPETPSLGNGRPTLLNLGLIVCVKAKEMPAWLAERAEAATYPSLTVTDPNGRVEKHELLPAASAACIDFASNPPVVRDAAGYFDEEVLALAWRLDWGGTPPEVGDETRRGDLANGAVTDVEHFLRAYEISFVDFGTQRVLHSTTAKPCEVLSGGNRLSRYGYSIARDEILPAGSDLSKCRLIATVTPLSQAGTRGASFSFTLELTPALTPLPADDAHLDLQHEKSWDATLDWRQPMLPQAAGIARTAGWQLVLRPLAGVPLGAYPEEAIDVTERGLMNTTGQALIEGDIIVPLVPGKKHAPFTYIELPIEKTSASDKDAKDLDDLPPAEKVLSFKFGVPKNEAPYFDHKGRRLKEGSALYQAVDGFFRRRRADQLGGRSWRMFLRAVTHKDAVDQKADTLPEFPVSGLSAPRLAILTGGVPRPLPFFEWPADAVTDLAAGVVAAPDLAADANLLHVLTIRRALETPSYGDPTVVTSIGFVPKPGRERAITVSWNAVPSGQVDASAVPQSAIAAYTVHEVPLDGLINFDLDNLNARATPLRRVVPTDPARARLHPSSMADTQNWEAQYPVFAQTRAHLETGLVAPEDMLEHWPGSHSWAESELVWPARLSEEQIGSLKADPTLGVLLEEGEGFARARVHPYLALLFAQLSKLDDRSLQLQVEPAIGPPTSIADPVKWLAANSEPIDPYGWAGLSVLGLAAAFSLREPITGILVEQGRVLDRIEEAKKRLNLLLQDALSSATTNHVFAAAVGRLSTVADHMMIELPIQHPQAYRARAEAADLDDIGLAMVQVSLRPLPEPVAHYDVICLGKPIGGTSDTPRPAGRFDIQFAGIDRPAITIETRQDFVPKSAFAGGETLLVRGFLTNPEGISFRRYLEGHFEIKQDPEAERPVDERDATLAELAQRPVATFAAAPGRLHLTPFGRFQPLPSDSEVPPGFAAEYFETWVDYLAHGFARRAPGDDRVEALAEATEALRKTIIENKVFETYQSWAKRFFATAPLRITGKSGELTLGLATAQPKSVEPVQIAADGRGQLRFTRFVNEEWATAKSYAVSWEGRYDRLVGALQANTLAKSGKGSGGKLAAALPAKAARRDVSLPRVRRLEPPTVLSARAVRARDKRPFNEIVVSHAELRLSESNTEVAAKLEFGDIRRRYQREFGDGEYLELLRTTFADTVTPLLDGPVVSPAITVEGDWDKLSEPPDLSEHDETLLFAAPAARWGATRYQDAAEPFYYRQIVTIEATAARRLMTRGNAIVLPSGDRDGLNPLGLEHSADVPARIRPLEWSSFWTPTGLDALWPEGAAEERAKRAAEWEARINVEPKQAVVGLLKPSGYVAQARLPRYAESLDPALRDGPFAYELVAQKERATAGLLPDAGTRLIIADLAPGETFVPLVQVSPVAKDDGVLDPPWARAFRISELSSGYETAGYTVGRHSDESNWSGGLFARFAIRPSFHAAINADFRLLPPMSEIAKLVDPNFTTIIARDELPRDGALARLAPLAIRLAVSGPEEVAAGVTVALVSPLAVPRWALRPSLVPASVAGALPAGEEDLAIGLRLLLDFDRRRAASLVAWDELAKPMAGGGLLELVERSEFIVLLDPGCEDNKVQELRKLQFEVFERIPEGGTFSWRRVEGAVDSAENWKIALLPKYGDIEPSAVDDAMTKLFDRPAYATNKRNLDAEISRLVGAAYRPAAMRPPAVFAQRGNETRVPWPTEVTS